MRSRIVALACFTSLSLLVGCSSQPELTYAIPDGYPEEVARPPAASAITLPADVDESIEPGQLYIPVIDVNSNILTKPTIMSPDPFLGGQVVSSFGVPPDLAQTAWWADGPDLGAAGMAVITGHSSGEPDRYAVFNRLPELKAGDEIAVESRAGDKRVRFRVISVVTGIPKSDPAALSRTLTLHPDNARLALLTCEGALDSAVAESPDNTIVFAERA